MELISERAAARRLATCGLSLSASQHLLATGIAGQPIRTAAATLYDASAVDELASRPALSLDETPSMALLARFWTSDEVPLLLTVSGVVICGATAIEFTPPPQRGGEFDACLALETPGTWLAPARGRMLAFGRGATIELLGDLAWVRNDRTGRSAERARR